MSHLATLYPYNKQLMIICQPLLIPSPAVWSRILFAPFSQVKCSPDLWLTHSSSVRARSSTFPSAPWRSPTSSTHLWRMTTRWHSMESPASSPVRTAVMFPWCSVTLSPSVTWRTETKMPLLVRSKSNNTLAFLNPSWRGEISRQMWLFRISVSSYCPRLQLYMYKDMAYWQDKRPYS